MNNLIKKIFDESNLIIVIPAIFVILIVIFFTIYGLQSPTRMDVSTTSSIVKEQKAMEESMLKEYNEGTYTETNPYTKVNPYGISPMSALIMFETDEATEYTVIVKGDESFGDMEYTSNISRFHMIPVIGLYEGLNTVEIYNEGNLVYTYNPVVTIDSESHQRLPEVSIETEYLYFKDDFMLLTPATGSLPVAYDYNGDLRWFINTPLGFGPHMLENGHLLIGTDRIISDPYYTTGLYEMDYLGKIYKEYYVPGGYHHDAMELENGNLLVLTSDFQGTVEDIIVELDKNTGTIVKTWDLKDYLPTTDGMSQMWTSSDWFHNNSIDYDSFTNSIILSGRHQDAVVSIGYDSGELNWILGDPTNWDNPDIQDKFFTPISDDFEWQYAQHSALILDDGDILIFDNGNNKSKDSESYVPASESYSRGVIYDINTNDMTIKQVYQFGKELGSDFYSPYISNVNAYADNHYMIHSGGISSSSIEGPLNIPAPLYRGDGVVTQKSVTIEVLNNVVKYRLELDSNYYRAMRVTPYNDKTTFNLSSPKILGNQDITPQYTGSVENKLTIFKNVPVKYELSLLKETDRLVVEGIFNRYDLIYVVLQNDDTEVMYHIPTSRSAYTAMCSAVFQGDERFLTYYINEEGLSGTFQVYLNINGHKYDTYEQVTFT